MQEVSVIVCHHKGTLVYNALKSLLAQKNVKCELILASSDEKNINKLQKDFPSVNVVFIEGGPARKRNIASKFASFRDIAFFDDDVDVETYSLFYMSEALRKDSSVGMVYGKLLNMEHRDRFDEAGSFLTWSGFLYARCESGILDYGQYNEEVPILSGKSASCIVRRKVFWEVGGFDESYEILGEETDLSWRIWLRGHKVMYCPKSITYHAFNTRFKPQDFYTPKRVYFNGCKNYLSMLLTNISTMNLPVPICVQCLAWSMAGIGMFLAGKFKACSYIFKGLFYVFTHLSSILRKRRLVQSIRVISDKELFKYIKYNPPLKYYWNRFLQYIRTGRHG